MILGSVSPSLEARLPLTLQGPGGQTQQIDAAIDTGFNGFLTLPLAVINALSLRWLSNQTATLAGGGTVTLSTYAVTVQWDGGQRTVQVEAIENQPLVGMALLEHHELQIQVRDGGSVTITALP
jgi:clan AA aspartic protease